MNSYADEVYRWVDKDGNVKYSGSEAAADAERINVKEADKKAKNKKKSARKKKQKKASARKKQKPKLSARERLRIKHEKEDAEAIANFSGTAPKKVKTKKAKPKKAKPKKAKPKKAKPKKAKAKKVMTKKEKWISIAKDIKKYDQELKSADYEIYKAAKVSIAKSRELHLENNCKEQVVKK